MQQYHAKWGAMLRVYHKQTKKNGGQWLACLRLVSSKQVESESHAFPTPVNQTNTISTSKCFLKISSRIRIGKCSFVNSIILSVLPNHIMVVLETVIKKWFWGV